jgi:acyl carrier protein
MSDPAKAPSTEVPPTDDMIARDLAGIFHATFEDDAIELRPETTAADILGWDSLRMVMLIVAVEERFGIETCSAEIDQLRCVGDLARLIRDKTRAPRPA